MKAFSSKLFYTKCLLRLCHIFLFQSSCLNYRFNILKNYIITKNLAYLLIIIFFIWSLYVKGDFFPVSFPSFLFQLSVIVWHACMSPNVLYCLLCVYLFVCLFVRLNDILKVVNLTNYITYQHYTKFHSMFWVSSWFKKLFMDPAVVGSFKIAN